jgi:hypothetical protein
VLGQFVGDGFLVPPHLQQSGAELLATCFQLLAVCGVLLLPAFFAQTRIRPRWSEGLAARQWAYADSREKEVKLLQRVTLQLNMEQLHLGRGFLPRQPMESRKPPIAGNAKLPFHKFAKSYAPICCAGYACMVQPVIAVNQDSYPAGWMPGHVPLVR